MSEELMRHQIEVHDKRLNNYGERLDKLEQEGVALKTEIKNLCENIKSLTNMMKWFITALIGAFISFFFYVVQQGIFK